MKQQILCCFISEFWGINLKENSSAYKAVSIIKFRELNWALSEFNFPYAIIKGEPLSLLAYGKTGMRISNDIDLLIAKENVKDAGKILMRHGFCQDAHDRESEIMMNNFSHQTLPFRKFLGAINIEIDLNHSVFWGEYKGDKNVVDIFLEDVNALYIYNYRIYTLSPMKSLVQLLLHQYKDMNSIYLLSTRKKYNLRAFKDIYNLLKRNLEKIDILEFSAFCKKMNICPYIFYGLYYTYHIFPDPVLKQFMDACETAEGVKLLDYYGLFAEERKLWKVDFETRLQSTDLFQLIEADLTQSDLRRIEYNILKL